MALDDTTVSHPVATDRYWRISTTHLLSALVVVLAVSQGYVWWTTERLSRTVGYYERDVEVRKHELDRRETDVARETMYMKTLTTALQKELETSQSLATRIDAASPILYGRDERKAKTKLLNLLVMAQYNLTEKRQLVILACMSGQPHLIDPLGKLYSSDRQIQDILRHEEIRGEAYALALQRLQTSRLSKDCGLGQPDDVGNPAAATIAAATAPELSEGWICLGVVPRGHSLITPPNLGQMSGLPGAGTILAVARPTCLRQALPSKKNGSWHLAALRGVIAEGASVTLQEAARELPLAGGDRVAWGHVQWRNPRKPQPQAASDLPAPDPDSEPGYRREESQRH